MNPELKQQIEKEARLYADNLDYPDEWGMDKIRRGKRGIQSDWEAGANHYATLWRACEDRVQELHVEIDKHQLLVLSKIKELTESQERVRELEKALEACKDALENSYDVKEFPASGESLQDKAIAIAATALSPKNSNDANK